ncbi:MAG: hypothetical protein QF830_13615, partial [Rhodospirillales bacterium]|nr:hypothetical protein [Rhodospirillales bacterium]
YAWALVRSGHDDAAIPVLIYSLGVEPLLRASVELLSNVLKNMVITKWEGRIPDELAVAFREDVDHQPFSKTSLAILGMHEPLSAAYAMGRDRGWNAAAKWFLCSKE